MNFATIGRALGLLALLAMGACDETSDETGDTPVDPSLDGGSPSDDGTAQDSSVVGDDGGTGAESTGGTTGSSGATSATTGTSGTTSGSTGDTNGTTGTTSGTTDTTGTTAGSSTGSTGTTTGSSTGSTGTTTGSSTGSTGDSTGEDGPGWVACDLREHNYTCSQWTDTLDAPLQCEPGVQLDGPCPTEGAFSYCEVETGGIVNISYSYFDTDWSLGCTSGGGTYHTL